jgi:hypothetical protein
MVGNMFPVLFAVLCGGFFLLVLLGLGIYLINFSMRSKKKTEDSQNWPSTTGTITLAEAKTSISRDSDGDESVSYYPHVEFTYQVGIQTFNGNRISFGGVVGKNNQAAIQQSLSRYTAGSQVIVFYNPQNNAEAVLERKAGGFKGGMAAGIICVVLAACIACGLLVALISNLGSLG